MTPQYTDAIGVTLPAHIDLDAVREAWQRMVDQITAAFRRLARALEPLTRYLREAANDPVAVAGLEARYAVRAGLDYHYATPEALHDLVHLIMAGDAEHPGDRQLRLLTLENRSLIAAAAITGWCHSHDGAKAILAWHRLMGTTALVVTRA